GRGGRGPGRGGVGGPAPPAAASRRRVRGRGADRRRSRHRRTQAEARGSRPRKVLRIRKPGQFAPGTGTRVRPDASGDPTSAAPRVPGPPESRGSAAPRPRSGIATSVQGDGAQWTDEIKKPSPQSVLSRRHSLGRGPCSLQPRLNRIDALQRLTNRRETGRKPLVFANESTGTGVASRGRCRETRC